MTSIRYDKIINMLENWKALLVTATGVIKSDSFVTLLGSPCRP